MDTSHQGPSCYRLEWWDWGSSLAALCFMCLLSPGCPLVQPLIHLHGLHLLAWELLCSKPDPSAPCLNPVSCCFQVHARPCRRRVYHPNNDILLICPLWG